MYRGIATAAKIPSMIVTMINSISVNPLFVFFIFDSLSFYPLVCGFGVLVFVLFYGCNFFQKDDGDSKSATNMIGAIDCEPDPEPAITVYI
tara:strand:- start:20 stop:292 length:273 start_codon:yes stop_codon:yes gene_type:complete